jgi:hypothetical protein
MSVTTFDIWRSADELIKRHGEDAAIHAAMKADELLAIRSGGYRASKGETA